ncbi:MAG: hypothetical protein HPZ91_17065 [Lentisphaeria bacterium]|nr:hypothetical protein [Lentisphaeria bacterium]
MIKRFLLPLMMLAASATQGTSPATIEMGQAKKIGATGESRYEQKGGSLRLSLVNRPGNSVRVSPGKAPDAASWCVLTAEVKNCSPFSASLRMAIESYDPRTGKAVCGSSSGIALRPQESGLLKVRYFHSSGTPRTWIPKGMMFQFDGFQDRKFHVRTDLPYRIVFSPEVNKVDRGKIFRTMVQEFEVSRIFFEDPAANKPPVPDTENGFYPFIDRFGQYKHDDWPLKIRRESDFAVRRGQEEKELASSPAIPDRNEFGGWSSGPEFKATGHFHTTKYQGKWFLVDPSGRLFWSHGLGSINTLLPTGVENRENYFEGLPPADDPVFSVCYGSAVPRHSWYRAIGKKSVVTYNFCLANILRKYGPDGKRIYADLMPRRLRHWGFNTMGNWSFPENYRDKKFPYAINLDPLQPPVLSGDTGHWVDFFDVFSPGFAESLERRLTGQLASTLKDPFCIGYFVGNELSWGHEWKLADSVLRSKPAQPAKLAFAAFLREKYGSVEKLNAAWRSSFISFDDFLKQCEPNDTPEARPDMIEFNDRIIRQYFSVIRQTLDRHAPGKLFLGCRYNWYTQRNLRIAAEYVDVLSFNIYSFSPAQFQLPDGVDMPVMIGEFHFGSLRSSPPGAILETADAVERGKAYRRYVEDALRHPAIVGTHYFQLGDSMATGRPKDGENMNIGMVDITDTPYPEMVDATRDIGQKMYEYRLREDAR